MSYPIVTKVSQAIVQGPPSASSAVSKLAQFIIVDTTRSDVATPARKRVQGHIRYGDNR